MLFTMENGIFTVSLTAITTVAVALLMLLMGQQIKNRVILLQRYCIPSPVIGGVIFAVLNLLLHQTGRVDIIMITTYQSDMQNLFFTCVGFGITFSLVKRGGSRLIKYFLMAAVLATLQGGIGVMAARAVHVEDWLGLMCGPAALSGGHGNAAAYGGILDDMGYTASVVGMAAATFGLVSGSLCGGPMAERLINRYSLVKRENNEEEVLTAGSVAEAMPEQAVTVICIFGHIALLCLLLGIGIYIKSLLNRLFGITIPDFAGGALLACIVSNVNEHTKWLKINTAIMDGIQHFTLGVFLSIAMISLRLWELAELAVPMIIILFVGLGFTLIFLYFVVFRICGRDFDAAIMCAGMCGHGLGASPTGFANMDSVTQRYGESRISYLCVTVVGGIMMDWVLLVLNTTMVNLFC